MIKIAHRINTSKELKNIPVEFGVEIDIRTCGYDLILHHDPYTDGEKLVNWLKSFQHKFLILNVKEEGLEDQLLKLMKKSKINNFFFLDQSFPFLIKSINDGVKNCAVRLSEYESIYTVLKLSGKVDWVWIDFFSRFPLNRTDINLLKREKFKLCLVSPELQGYSAEKEIPKIINILGEDINKIDAVCSKQIELWTT